MKVLVVEQARDVHKLVASCLEQAGATILHAENTSTARKLLESDAPDVCLLDMAMPEMSGQAFCKELSDTQHVGIIALSDQYSQAQHIKLLHMGADDYVAKPIDALELRARILALARRIRIGARPIARGTFSGGRFQADSRRLERVDGKTIDLSPGESAVLSFMLQNPNVLLDRKDILAISRMRQHGGASDRSVDNLMRRLRQKIELNPSRPKHILTDWGRGYRFVE